MAAASVWAGGFAAGPRTGRWLVVWAVLAAIYAVPEFASFRATGAVEVPAYEDPWVHLRTVVGIGTRYLVMAVSSFGVAAFQEPEPAYSVIDPWWLAALPVAGLLSWRIVVALRRRSDEVAYWLGAAVAFAPVSQVFPFLVPIADRYLYFILPGLIGAALFLAVEAVQRWNLRRSLVRGFAVAAGVVCVAFAWQTAARARLWMNETLLYIDAARHYPEGGTAAFLEARAAAQRGDAVLAVAALRRAADRGIDSFMVLRDDPGLAPVRATPEFRAFLFEMAGRWIATAGSRPDPTAPELRVIAHAHLVRGEHVEAEALLAQALELGGPLEPIVREELAALRARSVAEEGPGHRTPLP
jgi:hypothetical protein